MNKFVSSPRFTPISNFAMAASRREGRVSEFPQWLIFAVFRKPKAQNSSKATMDFLNLRVRWARSKKTWSHSLLCWGAQGDRSCKRITFTSSQLNENKNPAGRHVVIEITHQIE
jgi:hypothetical protein